MKNFGNVLWGIVLIIMGIIVGGNALGITNINIFLMVSGHCSSLYLVLWDYLKKEKKQGIL